MSYNVPFTLGTSFTTGWLVFWLWVASERDCDRYATELVYCIEDDILARRKLSVDCFPQGSRMSFCCNPGGNFFIGDVVESNTSDCLARCKAHRSHYTGFPKGHDPQLGGRGRPLL